MGKKNKGYDFSGWATRPNVKCSDGRTIMPDAFADQDGQRVPLVYQHGHDSIDDVLGHAILESRDGGIYAYGYFNDTNKANTAKECLKHGDVTSLSIFANKLEPKRSNIVSHGIIRELSLVLAGANPYAYVDNVVYHSDGSMQDLKDDEVVMWGGEGITCYEKDDPENNISHSDNNDKNEDNEEEDMANREKTVEDIFNSMDDDQKSLVIAALMDEDDDDNDDNDDNDNYEDDDYEEDYPEMKHNVFEDNGPEDFLMHMDTKSIIEDAKKNHASLKETFRNTVGDKLDCDELEHSIQDIEYLYPNPKELNNPPEFITVEPSGWVHDIMSGVHRIPFSRVKTSFANITEQEARAKGYIKGSEKTDEVITLLKRITEPTTIYKAQRLDRDDIIDITDFDVVSWIRREMRAKLDEEMARAILFGDGRLLSDNYKIDENHIRPIAADDALFSVPASFMYDEGTETDSTDQDEIGYVAAKHFVDTVIRTRRAYRGTGNPTMYITEQLLSEILICRDLVGRRLYESEEALAKVCRVKKIVSFPCPADNDGNRKDGLSLKYLHAIIVNPDDYNLGADKGGAISLYNQFDIDFNKEKYLIETRASGALVKPYSALCYFHIPATGTQFAWQKKNILINPNEGFNSTRPSSVSTDPVPSTPIGKK